MTSPADGGLPSDGTDWGRYRPWFYAAALYNLLWGVANVLVPQRCLRLFGLPPETVLLPIWQVVGMFVLVYAPAYWWAGRDPARHRHLILIGLLGKLLGPLGFCWAVGGGRLPLTFGLTILTNDLIWWPVFFRFARDAARHSGGLAALLRGD